MSSSNELKPTQKLGDLKKQGFDYRLEEIHQKDNSNHSWWTATYFAWFPDERGVPQKTTIGSWTAHEKQPAREEAARRALIYLGIIKE
ncbi:hypothetical protein FRC15_008064 [Serendipita sp. 397]|nr:hypothetical protein FRC15_008064 [Serendipita sp. 397]